MRRTIVAIGLLTAASVMFLVHGAAAAEPTAARQDFDKSYAEYKACVKKLTDFQNRYPVATPEERPAMEKQFNDLLKEGNTIRPKMIGLAEKAYVADPKDQELADMMFAVVGTMLATDDYEEAFRISQLLIDNKYPRPQVYDAAGTAAFYIGKYDDAEKFLKLAADNNVLDNGKDVQDEIKVYRAKWAREQKFRDADAKANNLPRVKLTIGDSKGNVKGDIVVELFEDQAPNTVANFISLVEKKKYDGLIFHRVLPHFMAQGGDPDGNGMGGPGYHIVDECGLENHREHFRGSLSMAHGAAPNSNGSQFFINFRPTGHLDGKHTVFGRVIEGMDLLAKIQRTHATNKETGEETPIPGIAPDKIITAEVIRKRDHAYEPKKLP